ncbi:hypothetical protein GcC1_000019 [Golovinomyces cichoracearum]|uniref:Uncharacterized protein n=1 Tax=Golovinomyces cichoracearum TaxID=62708 RepID=A0A420J9Z2_9PEZI|nr:hypothetical protein GcC1_000019 [Golovinomyces cichoracearum]
MSSSSELQPGVLSENSLGKLPDSTDTLNDKDLQNLLRYGFQPSNHSVETIDKFTQWRIQIYHINRYNNSNLSNEFADDFQYFNKTNFEKTAKDIKPNLRSFHYQ